MGSDIQLRQISLPNFLHNMHLPRSVISTVWVHYMLVFLYSFICVALLFEMTMRRMLLRSLPLRAIF